MIRKILALPLVIIALLTASTGLQHTASAQISVAPPWTTLFDGSTLDGWKKLGDANWTIVKSADGDYVEATSGPGFLMTPRAYTNFHMRLEFWTDPPANSGIFIRCSKTDAVGADNAYEVNIFDQRPDPKYRTGGIVNVAEPKVKVDAAGRWNTYEITADGPTFTVKMNGVLTAEGSDAKFASGPIALQYGAGTVRFRNVQIQTF